MPKATGREGESDHRTVWHGDAGMVTETDSGRSAWNPRKALVPRAIGQVETYLPISRSPGPLEGLPAPNPETTSNTLI